MRILFIAWDGPHVNYLDGLFLPIFSGLKKYGYEFHILHFTWADDTVVNNLHRTCQEQNIEYRWVHVLTWPHPVVGKFFTVLTAARHVVAYVDERKIDALMPRTMMPARISSDVLRRRPNLKLIFDADGLPIEERVDFAGLRKNSLRYAQLKKIEKFIIGRADLIVCRSARAIEFLTSQYGEDKRPKFHVVVNGRDENVFKRSGEDLVALKQSLGIPSNAFVMIYCGSLGPQYAVEQMFELHEKQIRINPDSFLLVLTGNQEYLSGKFQNKMQKVIVRRVPGNEVPRYIAIADVGLALRKATMSMQGVAPVKLGEYLLMGIPVIASAGIGDTEQILSGRPFCMVVHDLSETSLENAVRWIRQVPAIDASEIRRFGVTHFGLRKAIDSYQFALSALFPGA